MTGVSLAVSMIGQSLAQARGLLSKHAIKQVDRLLSNQGIVVWDMFEWVAEVVGAGLFLPTRTMSITRYRLYSKPWA